MRILVLLMAGVLVLSCQNEPEVPDHLELKSKLSGKWTAKAFDGELHETWQLMNDGWMHQEGYYIEKNDTTYAAKTQIQKVGDDVVLFSVIRNSNPKIFKSIHRKDNTIVFENDDYKNPFEVKYEFISDTTYRRTIRGYENDSLVIYTFNFNKQK
ncbi:MAG: hypothetical protein HKN89_00690 [Eudoraea sp.]|nr:hypothetical protein [Eudoraea sp.]